MDARRLRGPCWRRGEAIAVILGANGIVGGGLPIAVGAAFSAKRLKTGAVAAAFFGDGANNEGAFHESLNLASVWKLPVIFVCENNLYGLSVSTARSTAVKDVASRAAAYAMPGVNVDGNDFAAVAQASFAAADRARAGEGPSLIERKTYRTRGHSRSDRNRYRTGQEIEARRARDPIALFERELGALGLFGQAELEAIAAAAEREVTDGVAFAEASPVPSPDDLLENVYTPAGAPR